MLDVPDAVYVSVPFSTALLPVGKLKPSSDAITVRVWGAESGRIDPPERLTLAAVGVDGVVIGLFEVKFSPVMRKLEKSEKLPDPEGQHPATLAVRAARRHRKAARGACRPWPA